MKYELMPVTWYPTREQDWCMSQDEKKGTFLIDKIQY